MDKNKYYQNLVALFESTKELNEAPKPATSQTEKAPARKVPNQIDPLQSTVQQQAMPEEPVMQDPGLSDADYLQDPMMDPMMMEPQLSPVEQAIEVSEQKKMLKLLELYRELMNYSKVFYESLEIIDTNLIDSDKNHELRQLKKKLLDLSEKIKDFVIDRFADETYEKALYIYILLRTELLTITKMLRQVLDLNRKKQEDKLKNKKK